LPIITSYSQWENSWRGHEVKHGRILLANELYRRQGRHAGGPGSGRWAPIKPGDEPVHIDRGGRRNVLEMCFRESPVSGIPQPKAADALRQRPCDTRALFIALLPFCTAVPGSCRLQRLKFCLRVEGQAPGGLCRPGA
jgi:hypothetical protein